MSFYNEPTLHAAASRVARAALRSVPLFALALMTMAAGFAQSTGSIRGNVENVTTGKALTNAKVEILETGQIAYTNEYGVYRFPAVSPGEKTLRVSFIGLQNKSVTVDVAAGSTVTRDVALYSNRQGIEEEEVFELEAFTVDSSGYDSNAIALNEQRASANLKSVQHAEAFGEIAEGNIGEYLKNLPGVSVNYVAADVRAIKLRGMSPTFTQVTVDGSQMASAGSGNKIRSFELEQVSLANVEQLEVSKLPLPSMPANAIGGSVNLVSKNAFAQDGPQFNYKLSMNFNDEHADLDATPGWPSGVERSKVLPGVELNYSDLFMDDKLGVMMTYKLSNMFNIQQRFRWREWDLSPNGGAGGPEESYYQRLQVQDGPKKTSRESFSANFDYKINDDTTLSLKTQANTYDSTFFNRNNNWRIRALDADDMPAGITGSTDDVSDVTYTFGENRGIGQSGSFRSKYGSTYHVDLGMKHYIGQWRIDYGISRSEATNHYRDVARGFMETFESNARVGEYISFEQSQGYDSAFSNITVYDEDMNVVPEMGVALDTLEIRRVRNRPKNGVDRINGLRFNARRDFELGDNSGYFQFGARRTEQAREAHELRLRSEWSGYNTDADDEGGDRRIWLSQFMDPVYSGQSPGFGYPGFNWGSPTQLKDFYLNNLDDWEFEESRALGNVAGSYLDMEERIDALYGMAEIRSADNKLSVLAGIRYEKTDVHGNQPIVSDANLVRRDGTFYLETLPANFDYDYFHPSVHVKYNATDRLLLRFSYADTIGRPSFGDMFGLTVINDPVPDEDGNIDVDAQGFIETKNPGLTPRRSDNFDITAEYYYANTGLFSISLFRNDMENFIQTVERDVTAEDVQRYGLPDRVFGGQYDYRIETTSNVGSAQVDGLELNWNQGLAFDWMPELLRASSFYANGTFLSTEGDFGPGNPFNNDFEDFAKTTFNYGFLFEKGPVDLKLRWNIRGDEIGGDTRGYTILGESGDTALYREKRKSLDVDFAYKFNDRASLFVNARNFNDAPHRQGYYLPAADGSRYWILEREERFGVQWTVGVKGKF